MTYKKRIVTYLAGPMESVNDSGVIWRDRVTPKLQKMGIIVLDPCKDECAKTGYSLKESRERLFGLKRSGKWSRFDEKMDAVIKADINNVDNSDFLIVYFDQKVMMGGTICEMNHAYEITKIPIYVVFPDIRSNMNSWMLRTVRYNGEVFSSFSKLLTFIRKKYYKK